MADLDSPSPTLRAFALRPGVELPRYATPGAAGLDLRARLDAPLLMAPGSRASVPTGLTLQIPAGHEGQVRPRSGLARRYGLTVLNAPGTIDEDYRGEVHVLLVHHGEDDVTLEDGDRIAQLVIAPVRRVTVESVSTLDALGVTERGDGGFGSTGSR